MVLQELGKKLQSALKLLTNASVIDANLLNSLLKEICVALLESDVNVKLVQKLRKNVKHIVNLEKLEAASNKKKVIHKAIFDQLCKMVDPGIEPYKPVKGKANVIMFVGLQGAGKTTSCTKLAYYYSRKGFKTCLVCTDTFRAGAFDQLKQNATKAKIPFYGSYSENDPVQLALDGVAKFKKEKFEVIIVDTSGRHKQDAELFEEMRNINAVVVPDNVVFVLDGTIGQAADMHARAFKESVAIGSIIITKMDGHAKGGGAISAVAATKSPIIFIGTGEHMQDLELFKPASFVNKMLGMGDISGLMETLQESSIDKESLIKNITAGKFSFRDMKGQFEMIAGMGPMSQILNMIPGMSQGLMSGDLDKHGGDKLQHYTCVMNSMTAQELDSDGKIFRTQPSRIYRVAKGAGVSIQEVQELMIQHQAMAGMVSNLGGPNGVLSNLTGNGGVVAGNPMEMMSKMMSDNGTSPGGFNPMEMMSKMMSGNGANPGGFNPMEMMSKMMGGNSGSSGGLNPMDMITQMMSGNGGGMPDLSSLMGVPSKKSAATAIPITK